MRPATIATLLAALVLAGCGGDDGNGDPGEIGYSKPVPRPAAAPPPALPPARCPAEATNCASADGTILYVERIDPDGDGDAHFVLVSDESITAPGISVIDVRPALRPHPLPGPGEQISAAGPVFPGSFGQRQIQANVLHTAE